MTINKYLINIRGYIRKVAAPIQLFGRLLRVVLLLCCTAWGAACPTSVVAPVSCNTDADCPYNWVCGAGLCRARAVVDGGETPPQADANPAVEDWLQAHPSDFRLDWLLPDQQRELRTTLTRSDDEELAQVRVSTLVPWLQVNPTVLGGCNRCALQVDVDTTGLAPGVHTGGVDIVDPSGVLAPTRVEVKVRVLALPELRVGAGVNLCPREVEPGTLVIDCDHHGVDGLAQALAAVPEGGARVLLHDNAGARFDYQGCVDVPGGTWLSAAAGSDPAQVNIVCSGAYPDYPIGVLHLVGNGIHVEELRLIGKAGARYAFSAFGSDGNADGASTNHLIENVRYFASRPEHIGHNSIVAAFQIGADTTVRNCELRGYFESRLDLTRAHRSRVLNNTFVPYQAGFSGFDVSGAEDVVVANNAIAMLTRVQPELIRMSPFTSQLTVAGNVVEGFEALTTAASLTTFHTLTDNVIGGRNVLELESPLVPRFLSDSTQRTGYEVAGEGRSLDGVVLMGRTDMRPGAWQLPSALGLPRRDTIRVGVAQCGDAPCDVLQSEDNEIQRAVWSAWPGGVIEIYAAPEVYAGNAVVGWGVTLRGVDSDGGIEPATLENRVEAQAWADWDLWSAHRSLLVALNGAQDPITLQQLRLQLHAEQETDFAVLFIEGTGTSVAEGWHVLERLYIERIAAPSEAVAPPLALYLGDRVRLQNSLIQGDFWSCARFGPRHNPENATPVTTGQWANVTCRLTGVGEQSAAAVLEVASVDQTLFANLAIEVATPAPLFLAQRRSAGDTGALARDVPGSFHAQAISMRGMDGSCADFTCAAAHHIEALEQIGVSDPFFHSETDAHLQEQPVASTALNAGVDPSTLEPTLLPGLSLDGVARAGRQIDRGAYEQHD